MRSALKPDGVVRWRPKHHRLGSAFDATLGFPGEGPSSSGAGAVGGFEPPTRESAVVVCVPCPEPTAGVMKARYANVTSLQENFDEVADWPRFGFVGVCETKASALQQESLGRRRPAGSGWETVWGTPVDLAQVRRGETACSAPKTVSVSKYGGCAVLAPREARISKWAPATQEGHLP